MRTIARGSGILILVLAGISVWMQQTQTFDPPPRPPQQFSSPILAMELVRSAEEVRSILGDPIGTQNRRVMRRQIDEDWPFIVTYWLLLLGLGRIQFASRWPGARICTAVVVLTATAAAICDVFENLGILLVLDSDIASLNDPMARTIRTASLAKWGSLAIAELAAAPALLAYRRGAVIPGILSTVAGMALLAASALGLAGLAWNPAIEWSVGALALGLATSMPLLLFMPGDFLVGIGAAVSYAPQSFRHLKWLVGIAVLAFLVVVAVVLTRTVLLRSGPARVPKAVDLAVDEDAAARRLAGAIHIDTVSHPIPTEREAAQLAKLRDYLAKNYPQVRNRLQWEEPEGNLLVTWKGSDENRKPLLLLAHMDVVPARVEEESTKVGAPQSARSGEMSPSSATASPGEQSRDGSSRGETGDWETLAFNADPDRTKPFIYGRGTLDDKVTVVGILEAVEHLLIEGFQPRRTLILAFGRDEEVGGKNGARKLVRLLEDRGIHPECVIDEGSYVLEGVVPGIATALAPVGVAEKGYVDVELSVRADGGHSSMPPQHTAIGILARAIASLEDNPFPARTDGIARGTIAALGPELPFVPRLLLVNDWLFGGLIRWGLARSPTTNALVRTTAAVTLIRGGTKDNVLPDSASAIVNFRPLPGDNSRHILEHVRRVIDDPRVRVEFADAEKYSEVFEATRVSLSDTPAYETLRTTIRQTFPGAVVVPYLVIAGTDARFYEGLTDEVYRFLPLRLASEDLDRIHGIDERIARQGFVDVVKFYYRLIKNFDD